MDVCFRSPKAPASISSSRWTRACNTSRIWVAAASRSIVRARSNRLEDLLRQTEACRSAMSSIQPGESNSGWRIGFFPVDRGVSGGSIECVLGGKKRQAFGSGLAGVFRTECSYTRSHAIRTERHAPAADSGHTQSRFPGEGPKRSAWQAEGGRGRGAEEVSLTEALGKIIQHVGALRHVGKSPYCAGSGTTEVLGGRCSASTDAPPSQLNSRPPVQQCPARRAVLPRAVQSLQTSGSGAIP